MVRDGDRFASGGQNQVGLADRSCKWGHQGAKPNRGLCKSPSEGEAFISSAGQLTKLNFN